MSIMQTVNATDIRKNWSLACDQARVRPSFIKRTHDRMFLSSVDNMIKLLAGVFYECVLYKEDDGSYTASLKHMDLAENAGTREETLTAMSRAILDYSEEYYDNYELYSRSPNRSSHLPYVTKALLLGSAEKIREEIVWQSGTN